MPPRSSLTADVSILPGRNAFHRRSIRAPETPIQSVGPRSPGSRGSGMAPCQSPEPPGGQALRRVQATRGDGDHRALKICFVLPPMERYYPRSGGAISTVTRHLTSSLLELGHSVDVLTPDDGEQPYAEGAVLRLRFGPASPPPSCATRATCLRQGCADGAGPSTGRISGGFSPVCPNLGSHSIW